MGVHASGGPGTIPAAHGERFGLSRQPARRRSPRVAWTNAMKAAVYTDTGLRMFVHITDIEQPVPKDNEVLIKVRAASVNPLDRYMMRGEPLLFARRRRTAAKPKITRLGDIAAGGGSSGQERKTVSARRRSLRGIQPGRLLPSMCARSKTSWR